MNKRDIIIKIRYARAAHMKWKSYAQIAIGGLITESSHQNIPIVQTEGEFGKWYYGDGMALSMMPSYISIEEPLENVYSIYLQIYTLQRAKHKGGFFGFFRNDEKKRLKEIELLTANFNSYNKILLDSVHQLEMEVMNLSEMEFLQMVNLIG